MRQLPVVVLAWLMVCALSVSPAVAQGEFPRVIVFGGVADGNSPVSQPVTITFAVYEAATGGAALFIESQSVALQPNRQFQVLLGAATPGGLPASLFVANQALFVGIQVSGQPEQTPRVMFASVPYALKAADADALGGVPASGYVTDAEAGAGNAYTDAQVAAEANARAAADNTLQGNIDAEAAARAAADTTLQSNVDAEAAARAAADSTLQNNIDAEAATRAAADTTLQSNIDAEAAARAAADSTLQNNIDAEAAARTAADTTLQSNIDAEAAARAAADSTLQNNIDAEAAARTAADTTLQSNIGAEAAARAAADTTLQSNIDAEAAARAAADATLQHRVTGACGAGSSLVSVNADGSVNCVSVDTNSGDDITSLSAGVGISISGAGNSRTVSNTGDTNAGDDITSLSAGTGISISGSGNSRTITNSGDTNDADDITSLTGSGGVTIAGSGNTRTIGHSAWSCGAGSSIRSIDAAGIVTCEPDDVGGGSGDGHSLDAADGNPIDAVFVNNDGNVGVRTTSPLVPLHVVTGSPGGAFPSGSLLLLDSTASQQFIAMRSSASAQVGLSFGTATNFIRGAVRYFHTAGRLELMNEGHSMTLTNDGNVGIGRVPEIFKLEVSGDASKDTAGGWNAHSDRRLKTDIREIDQALNVIGKLRPVKFRYSDEYLRKHPSVKDHDYYNYIAQEYQQVFPDSVQVGEDGYLMMESHSAEVVLVKAVQELHQMLKDKEAEIAAQKAQLEMLATRLLALEKAGQRQRTSDSGRRD